MGIHRTGLVTRVVGVLLLAASFEVAPLSAQVTYTNSYSTFLSALGPVSIEDFGPGACFPIGSTLNSLTSFPGCPNPIAPGDIVPGVTFSVAGGPLLIDSGGGFTGGMLDGSSSGYGTVGPLQVVFSGAVAGFGFWTNTLASEMSIDVYTLSGTSNTITSAPTGMSFFGWYAPSASITGATIANLDPDNFFNFIVDDFTFSAVTGQPTTTVPEPATMTLLATGLAGVVAARRRRQTPT